MKINRNELVTRHNPVVCNVDPYAPLSVGNGEFAYTADVTGMQTFPEAYREGIPLCTQSQWGWHTQLPDGKKSDFKRSKLRLKTHKAGDGREVGYATSDEGQEVLFHWLRQNPHRLHLGRMGMDIQKKDGTAAVIDDIQGIHQRLDMWKGIIESQFEIEGETVKTLTCCHPEMDLVSFRIQTPLITSGRCGVVIAFPYGSPDKTAADWASDEKHQTKIISQNKRYACFHRMLDEDEYYVTVSFSEGTMLEQAGANRFLLKTNSECTTFELSCLFTKQRQDVHVPDFENTAIASEESWREYWTNGGMIDFSGSTDRRAPELERRVILSQYLMAIQCAGSLPPQETGLTFNSWYGKYHLEMHWWHGVHFVQWGRPEKFEKSLWWYLKILKEAKELAQSQGYDGARWPKMVAYDGIDSPSPVGTLLIWQQPHPIYYAELLYQTHPQRETLEKYIEMVLETAKFMASYVVYDKEKDRYNLGPGFIPVQENHKPENAMNAPFELEYWAFGLTVANQWRERLGMEPEDSWCVISEKLADFPQKNGVYLAHERCPDTFSKYQYDHPSMLGALGVLPGGKADPAVMKNTLKAVMRCWKLERLWGWDFPMIAMTAARLGEPELAVEALLLDSPKNEYLTNGHNKQADRKDLPIYLPGNGGLLSAVAMMVSGWNGCTEAIPGFPKDGTWKIAWEGLHPML